MRHSEYFLDLLELDTEAYQVIAVVGGGGKTSLIYRLCQELQALKKRVVIATTTHMAMDPERPFARDGKREEVLSLMEEYGYVIAAGLDQEKGKYTALPMEELRGLTELCDVMLIEADGAKHQPLKVPEAWEPVIPDFAQAVISVVGLDCLGKPIRETTHRMERTCEFLQKSLDAPVTFEDVVKIASSFHGLLKDVEDRLYRVYLNKTDVLDNPLTAERLVEELRERGTFAASGSLLKEAQRGRRAGEEGED
ncbi:MAG: selenium cofactor biosynthesis protein YqeC [Eubacteriales bacterium]|nr:selenium cofactor biosynthesis protein YqeC [Eubacteriales bacterium]